MLMRLLDRLEETLIATLIASATALIFIAVVHRYSLTIAIDLSKWGRAHEIDWLARSGRSVFEFIRHINLTWAQELCIYMFVWMAKFGAAYGVRTGIHVGVDVATQKLAPENRYRVVLFSLFCGALFTFVIGSLGAQFVYHMSQTDQISPDLEWPAWMIYLAIPCGSYLMSFRFMQVMWSYARTGELPHHDHGHVDGVSDETPTVPGIVAHGDVSAVGATR
ncbi:MAG: TRAP transporter small permease [Afipia sp.]|nr:TRAP transporter small permease [Afipia sp.]